MSDANAAQKQWLQSTYGENWEKGVEADPTVRRYDPGYAAQKKKEVEQNNSKKVSGVMKESVGELAQKRTISGLQAQRLANIADQI